jgi:putative ABC transport system permease protein
MIQFILKGLLRDKSRSLLPVIVVALGVMLTVFLHSYINGFMGDIIEINAKFSNGHVKVMTKAYAEEPNQMPNDLALVGVDTLISELRNRFPDIEWAERIQFGGLVDAPDNQGETRAQGPAIGMGIDLLSMASKEKDNLNLVKSLKRGKFPEKKGEILISDAFSKKLKVNPGDTITLIGSTMNSSMSIYNFVIAGTIFFGNEIFDRGAIIVDIADARLALDMEDAASEILGFQKEGFYDDEGALAIADQFNTKYNSGDAYAPVMKTLSQQGNMALYVKMVKYWTTYISLIFIIAMALVLWNAGLLGGLRRYGEMGVRLAMGETKNHVYRTMIYESVMIGIAGTVVGTAIGLSFALYLQNNGINISKIMKGASMMMPAMIKAHVTLVDYYIGFIPGLFSTVLGTMLSGIGIFKRQTAKLFKELEV